MRPIGYFFLEHANKESILYQAAYETLHREARIKHDRRADNSGNSD